MTYTREELSQLTRKELQKLCKQTNGNVKANKKTLELVNDLAEYYEREENEMKEMEAEMKKYETVDLNGTWTVEEEPESSNKSSTKNEENETSYSISKETLVDEVQVQEPTAESLENKENESNNTLKEALMQEVERRAEEKLSKIPRLFVADKVPQATPEVSKKKKSIHGLKTTDSIDVYLAKKQKRAEGQLNFKNDNKNKENNRMKMSNAVSSLPLPGKRKSVRVDKEISINFAPQVKSTPNPEKRVSPRLPAINSGRVSSINGRRSVIKSGNKEVKNGIDGRRFTVSSINSPTSAKLQTPKAKTPIQFDIKASLKKPLSYKPHTGKLKQVYFNMENHTSLPRKPVVNKVKTVEKKLSVKEMNKNVSTREKRRKDAADKRSKGRNVVLDKRRGIVC